MFRRRFASAMVLGAFVLAGVHSAAEADGKNSKDIQSRLVQKSYPVAELVVPVDTDKEPDSSLETPLRYLYHVRTEADRSRPATKENCLMELIRSRVAPASWQENGGQGGMQFFPLGMSLVIDQTPEVHQEIQAVLSSLRQVLDVEVAVEVRLLTLPEAALSEVGKDMKLAMPRQTQRKIGKDGVEYIVVGFEKDTAQDAPVILDDQQMRQLFSFLYGNRAANLMQAPRMTLFNGQGRTISVGDQQQVVTGLETLKEGNKFVIRPKTETVPSGVRFAVQPIVSADRQYVRLSLDFRMTNVDNTVPPVPVFFAVEGGEKCLPVAVEQPRIDVCNLARKLTIRDGHTAVLRGPTWLMESRLESPSPVLTCIPFVNSFIRTSGKDRTPQTLLVLVTPRVVVQESAEQTIVEPVTRR